MGFYPTPQSWYRQGPIASVVVGADTSTVTLSPLDEDADRGWLVEYWINNVQAPTVRDFIVRPNGLVNILDSRWLRNDSDTTEASGINANGAISILSGAPVITGWFTITTEVNPGGSSFDFFRRFESWTVTTDANPIVEVEDIKWFRASGYVENDSAVTSLDIVCTISGLSTPLVGIGAGSVFRTWSLA